MGPKSDLTTTYRREVEQLTARRVPQALTMFLICAAAFGMFECALHPASIVSFVAVFSLQILIALPLFLWRLTLLRRRMIVMASVAGALAVTLLAHLYLMTVHVPTELMGIMTVCMVTGMSLFMPWGPRPQAIVSSANLAVYTISLLVFGALSTPPLFLFFGVATGVLLSMLGAQYLDLYRFAIFREATLSEEEASINRTLVSIATEINAVLDRDDALDRICSSTRAALGCEWSLILLPNDAHDVFRVAAGVGRHSETLGEISAIEFTSGSFPLIDQVIAEGDVAISSDCADKMAASFMGRWHTRHLIATRLTSSGQIVGILAAGGRNELDLAAGRVRKLLRGIAQHAAIALNNVHLVTDLRAADRLKSEFLSTMSHELRTPLNVILGYTELLTEGAFGVLAPEQQDTLERIQRSGSSLLELITATLDVNRIEAGRVPLQLTTVALGELFKEVAGELHHLPRKPEVALLCNTAGNDARVRTDPTKVKVILKNLVGNALKFTDAGHVTVDLRYDRRGARLVMRVADTGAGIQPDELGHIFDMFRQAAGSRERGGVGLGLYIVKRFVEQLEGEVTVSSEVDKGSTFTVFVPAALERRLVVEQDAA